MIERTISKDGTIRYDGMVFRVYTNPERTPSVPSLAGRRVYAVEAPLDSFVFRRLLLYWDERRQHFITHADARIERPATAD
jgi:hypothetical protein